MLFDTHVHLNDLKYEEDLAEVLKRAEEAGVSKMLVVGFDERTNKRAIELAEAHEGIYASVGWHPVDAIDLTEDLWEKVVRQSEHPKVVAIGECGLDFYWDKSPKDVQREVFERQIELARQVKKPLIIHTRESIQAAYEVLKENHAQEIGGVMHCFSGSKEMAMEFLKLGFMISLGGPVTFKNGRKPQEVAEAVPLDSLLVETDAPYLAPHPFRGKRNEPAYIKLVAEQIAEIKGLTYESLCEATMKNGMELFNIR
ncbi:MAG: TatD family hydrolase [Turicibacter sp.]|nr:TatD family hydrolase [Turicibacter sp.]